ncbi:MAG: hypothetical protein FWE61_07370 [Micrococcales bacterium]|nr:hypothetical protein [Micrococcales bacterium]
MRPADEPRPVRGVVRGRAGRRRSTPSSPGPGGALTAVEDLPRRVRVLGDRRGVLRTTPAGLAALVGDAQATVSAAARRSRRTARLLGWDG